MNIVIKSFKKLDLSKTMFLNNDSKANWDTISKAIEGCDETALSYFKTLDDGSGTINNQSASVEGLEAHLRKTSQSFNFAATKTFDNYIHRVDNARNRTDELFSEFRQMNDTRNGHKNLFLYA